MAAHDHVNGEKRRPHPPGRCGWDFALVRPVTVVALTLVAVVSFAVHPTAVTSIVVRAEEEGTTVVELTVNGPGVPYAYGQHRDPTGEARGELRLRGILEPYSGPTITVRDCNLVRVRVDHHPEVQPPELRLVFDLAEPEVTALGIVRDGNRLLVSLGRRAAATLTPSATPTQTSSPTPTPTATRALPTPTPTSTSTPSRSPTPLPPSPTPAAPPRPTRTPRPTARPTPGPGTEPARPSPTGGPLTLYRNPQAPARAGSAPGLTASAVTEIVTSRRPDGATLLRITADQPFLPHSVVDYRDPEDPTQHMLLLLGVAAPGAPPSLAVNDACLRRIEVGSAGEGRPPEVDLTLVLTSDRVRVGSPTTQGANLALLLEPATAPQ
jgi:hypothetical protein